MSIIDDASIQRYISTEKSSRKDHRRKVSFSDITILEFPVSLGCNPSCSQGPPLTLSGVDPQKVQTTNVELYELFRDRRRDKVGLTLTARQRTEILLGAGYTEDDISDAVKALRQLRYERLLNARLDRELPSDVP